MRPVYSLGSSLRPLIPIMATHCLSLRNSIKMFSSYLPHTYKILCLIYFLKAIIHFSIKQNIHWPPSLFTIYSLTHYESLVNYLPFSFFLDQTSKTKHQTYKRICLRDKNELFQVIKGYHNHKI